MRSKSPIRILLLAGLVFVIGITVAYYNTSSFGYNDANIISFNDKEVKILGMDIEYEKVKEKYEAIKNALPNEFITI